MMILWARNLDQAQLGIFSVLSRTYLSLVSFWSVKQLCIWILPGFQLGWWRQLCQLTSSRLAWVDWHGSSGFWVQRAGPNEQVLFKSLCSSYLLPFPWPTQAICPICVIVGGYYKRHGYRETWTNGVMTACSHHKLNMKNTENGTHFIIFSSCTSHGFLNHYLWILGRYRKSEKLQKGPEILYGV